MNPKPNYLPRVFVFVALLFGLTHIGADAVTRAATPGQPGLSFRYDHTFGETGVAYLPDPQHQYLNRPFGIDVDASGNLWVAEAEGNFVAKYAPDGSLLGSIGTSGWRAWVDEDHFARSLEVSLDPAGNPWVVDNGSHRVIRCDPDGNYLMQIGITGQGGSDEEHFNGPTGVAFDSAGRIYVADTGNHRIQVFDSTGVYSTTLGVTGETSTDNNHFNAPNHLFIDSDDNLFVADTFNHRVQIFDVSYVHIATLGIPGAPGSDDTHLTQPEGVTADATNIYVVDSGNHRVQIFDRATFGYKGTLGWGTDNYAFDWPGDAAIDSDGNLYVADTLNNRVQKFNSSLDYQQTFGVADIPYISDGYHFNGPEDVAVDGEGNIAIVEGWWYGHRLIVLGAAGEPKLIIGEAGIPGSNNMHFNDPDGVAFDDSGNIYVSDGWNHRVQIYSKAGGYIATLGTGYGKGDYQFYAPNGLAVDSDGSIYVADAFNHRVQIFDRDLNYVATLGVTGETGSDNKHFNWPLDVVVGEDGDIYVADGNNHRVQVFDSNLAYQMTLGVTGECGNDFEHFCQPWGVALDAAGNIYVSEKFGPRVQVLNSSGAYLTTIGGAWGDASGQLHSPAGVAVDVQGNVYVADLDNHRVQKFAPGVPGWQQVNLNGFGERANRAVSTLASYRGQLYAGTLNFDGQGGQLWRMGERGSWTSMMADGFGYAYNFGVNHLLEFNQMLYASTVADEANGGEVWRSEDGATWTRVISRGFGDPTNGEVFRFAIFNDQLYASTWSYTDAHGTELWRSSTGNPSSWTRVVEDGFNGDANNATALSLYVFSGRLYAGTWNTVTGGEVWRTSNGTSWAQVNVDGFGTAHNRGVSALTGFEGYLYAATRGDPGAASDEVWRCQLCDGSDWVRVVANGVGNTETSATAALKVFGGYLYFVAGNEATGIEVWRTADGTAWTQVGFAGFGDSNNANTYWDNAVTQFDGQLFIGTNNTANGGEVWMAEWHQVFLPFPVKDK